MIHSMRWALEVLTKPAAEPLTTAEAKTHLRVTGSDDDVYINTLIKAARHLIEKNWGIAMINQTLVLYLDRFPVGGQAIMLPRPPSASITSVQFVNNNGVTETWDNSNYALDSKSRPGRLHRAFNVTYPTTRTIENAVIITYVAGYGAAGTDIDEDLLHMIKLLITLWYEAREAACPVSLTEIPFGVKNLGVDYKTYYRGPVA